MHVFQTVEVVCIQGVVGCLATSAQQMSTMTCAPPELGLNRALIKRGSLHDPQSLDTTRINPANQVRLSTAGSDSRQIGVLIRARARAGAEGAC